MSRQISSEEVMKHSDDKSSWIIIHHDIYDVTKFLDEHPGGADSLLEYAGKDGTQAFEDVAHSEDARELMKKYKIGTLPADERGPPIETGPKCNDYSEPKREPKKTWRTFDGGSIRSGEDGSRGSNRNSQRSGSIPSLPGAPKEPCGHCSAPRSPGECGVCAASGPKGPLEPQIVPRIKSIIAPRDSSFPLKWALIALAGAIIIGITIKKYNSG